MLVQIDVLTLRSILPSTSSFNPFNPFNHILLVLFYLYNQLKYEGVYATTTARATKTSLKKWIWAAPNLISLIPSRLIRQMLANSFGVEFQRTASKKKVVVFCSRPRQTWNLTQWCRANKLSIIFKKSNFMVFRPRQRRQTLDGREMYQKAWCTCKVVVFSLEKPIAFLPFSLPSPCLLRTSVL